LKFFQTQAYFSAWYDGLKFVDLTADVSGGAQLVIYVHYPMLSDMEEQFLSCYTVTNTATVEGSGGKGTCFSVKKVMMVH
jgi:hypothetical protein